MSRQKSVPVTASLLLLTIAVIAAIITVPTWHNHRISARVDQALQAGEAAKLVVMEAATVHGGLNQLKPGDLAFDAQSSLNAYTSSIDISESGRITITTRDTGASPDPVFLLTPLNGTATGRDAPITWSCDLLTGNPQWAPPRCSRPDALAPAVTPKA